MENPEFVLACPLHSFPFPSFLVTFSRYPFHPFPFLSSRSFPFHFHFSFFLCVVFPFCRSSSFVPSFFLLYTFPFSSLSLSSLFFHFHSLFSLYSPNTFSLSFFPALPHFPFRKEWGYIWHAGGFATETGSVVLAALLRSRPCFLLA